MANITSLVLTDTFNAFMTTVNSIIAKLNTITADASTATLAFSASAPSTATQANSTAIIFVDNADGKLKLQSKNSGGTVTTYILSTTS